MNKINFLNKTVLQSKVREGADYQNGTYLRLRSILRSRTLSLAIVIITTGMMAGGLQTSYAGTPQLHLSLSGPEHVQAGKPMDTIEVRLINSGKEAANSRLRLFIHDQEDREVQTDDIKIDLLEKKGWRHVSAEVIDGGIMTAIGAAGDKNNENHKKGGFHISKNATQHWQIRLTFRLPGRYTLVAGVSPDNGSTHLAKPASMKIEAL